MAVSRRVNLNYVIIKKRGAQYTNETNQGAGAKHCAVFLHGWGGSISSFSFIADRLNGNFRSLVVEFDGFGQTAEPDRAYSVADYAEEVMSAIKDNGFEKVSVVGHSFGGRVGIEMAAKYPSLVSSLVLVDSAGLRPRRKLSYYFKVAAHKIAVKLGFKGLKGSKDYRGLSPVMKETFKRVVNYDQTALLDDISCPTAVFWGRNDQDTPPYMARKFKRKIKNCELFWLDGGHFAYIDDSKTFIPILQAFLSQTIGNITQFSK